MAVLYETMIGDVIESKNQISDKDAIFMIPGVEGMIPISESLLSKHLLFIGGIGCGKTNTINHFVRNIRNSMTGNDVMIIFDAKGDYYSKFYQKGDIVISNDERCTDLWNIFEEVKIDDRVDENINEVAKFLFREKIEKSSNPFFPSAASDIFGSLMKYIIRGNYVKNMNNAGLKAIFDKRKPSDLTAFFMKYDDLRSASYYINDDAKGQAQGVISELQQTIREIFIGNFNKNGNFSIRRTIKNRKKKVIFIEYDLSIGKTLSPVYSLIIDLAIKEALCRKENEKGSVYFVMDEFRLLTPLDHMDNGINFGRSLGAKFLLGLQNAEQIFDVYGEYAGRSILSGCSTAFNFFVNDKATRELIKDRNGESIKKVTFSSQVANRGLVEQIMERPVIEDATIDKLEVGQAIVQSLNSSPFIFKFREFKY